MNRDSRIMWAGGFVGAAAVASSQGHFLAAILSGSFGIALRLSAEVMK